MRHLVLTLLLAALGCVTAPAARKPAGLPQESSVSFVSAGYTLNGTWSAVPDARVAAVLLHGSGLTDREETLPTSASYDGTALQPFLQLSRELNAAGLSTLRYDKRGVIETRATPPDDSVWRKTTLTALLADAREAVAWARRQPGIERVVLVGHSEGTWLSVRLASEGAAEAPVAALVLIGAMGDNLKTAVHSQLVERPVDDVFTRLDANHDGALVEAEIPPDAKAGLPLEALDTNRDGRISRTELTLAMEVQFTTGFLDAIASSADDALTLNKPNRWWKDHFEAPTAIALAAKVRLPVLMLQGARDPNVPAEQHALPLAEALRVAGSTVTLKLYPGYGHGLSPWLDGKPTLGPVQPDALTDLGIWVGTLPP